MAGGLGNLIPKEKSLPVARPGGWGGAAAMGRGCKGRSLSAARALLWGEGGWHEAGEGAARILQRALAQCQPPPPPPQ